MPVDLNFIKDLAREAGQRALAAQSTMRPELKEDNSWVTNVDREIQEFVNESILQRYPTHTLFGEESGYQGESDAEFLWLIDPIDGTTNFVRGIPAWCISIGLLRDGEPYLGVIAIPPSGSLYWAERGGGAFCNGEPIAACQVDRLHPEDPVSISSDALKNLHLPRLIGRIRNLGSAAMDLALVAQGSLVANIFLSEQAHDIAAGFCICQEAGCVAQWLTDGRPLRATELITRKNREEFGVIAPERTIDLIRACGCHG